MYRRPTGEVRALQGVSFDFPRGRLTAVAGASGSGKSSLLRVLAGMDRATTGSVFVGGMRLDDAKPRALRSLRRQVVGYVFQRPSDNFFPHLTLGEHLRLARGGARDEPRFDRDRLVDHLGLRHRIDHLPSQLSGGEQQRAAFAQVLLAGVEIVLADEPTAELDSQSSGAVLDAIDALIAEGVTFIVATHDIDVMRRAEVTLRLDHGIVVAAPTRWQPEGRTLRSARPVRVNPRTVAVASSTSTDRTNERATVLDVQHISKSYRRGGETVHAVRDVSLKLLSGEFVGLIGRSGSGKTTLLNIVSGWERADAGQVSLIDRDLLHDEPPPWSDLAVVPQKLGLMDELTIRENVEYPARLARVLNETRPIVEELLDNLGLRELEHRFPAETSIGEQQRAALARALVLSPRLVVADEPTGHQDLEWSRRMLDALVEALSDDTACLAASHGAELIRHLDRAHSMANGRLTETSVPA